MAWSLRCAQTSTELYLREKRAGRDTVPHHAAVGADLTWLAMQVFNASELRHRNIDYELTALQKLRARLVPATVELLDPQLSGEAAFKRGMEMVGDAFGDGLEGEGAAAEAGRVWFVHVVGTALLLKEESPHDIAYVKHAMDCAQRQCVVVAVIAPRPAHGFPRLSPLPSHEPF